LPHFIRAVESHLQKIVEACQEIIAIVGMPRLNPDLMEKNLFNSAAVIQNGVLLGFQDKMLLPTYDVFSERRYFEPASRPRTWNLLGVPVAITICEDIWQHSEFVRSTLYRTDPILDLLPQKPALLLNLSSSPYSFDKTSQRLKVCSKAAETLGCPVLMCNQVGGNDSLIFDGYSFYVDQRGSLVNYGKGFEEDDLIVDLNQEAHPKHLELDKIGDLYKALVLGLRDYFEKSGFKKACLGLSGGIDSALVACIAVEALGKDNVLALGMPSRYSSEESLRDAEDLTKNLQIEFRVISIETVFQSYLDLLTPSFRGKQPDVTEENLQARARGMILMAFSNKFGYIILSTGNKSELAMGYATLYGDMCGGLGVISDVTKMQVYALARWINREKEVIPQNTIVKPPSAELRPGQKDSDTLPAYEIVDTVLQEYVEEHRSPEEIAEIHKYPLALVKDLVWRIHRNEYKRRQAAPGLRVTSKSFSVGRRFPIVHKGMV
jgi:NAD+ synthase (glutamine-hydrolysing)